MYTISSTGGRGYLVPSFAHSFHIKCPPLKHWALTRLYRPESWGGAEIASVALNLRFPMQCLDRFSEKWRVCHILQTRFLIFSIRLGGKCLRTRGVETGLWPWPAGLHPLKSVRGTQTWGSPGCWCRCRYRCPFCLHLQRCVFWCVCSSGRSAWSACCTPGKQIASRPCECAGASGARLTWWTVCRKKASCTQRASRRCATSDALWGETFSRRLYRSPGCDSYEVLSSVGWRPQARASPPPGSSGSRMWPVRSISWTTWTRSRCPSWRRIS